jgi:hypothetical protein
MRFLHVKHKLDNKFTPFTDHDTECAIRRSSNSSAVGPDGLTALHLKNLGPHAVAYMTCLFNLSVSCANIPAIWKLVNIIPILKPGKPASDSKLYRPISLLSPVVKILERLLLPFVTTELPKSK